MRRILALLEKIEIGIIIAAFIVMTLAAFAQVLNRNIFHAGISWFEELSRYCMVYMALLATEVGIRDGSQLAITLMVDRFRGAPRRLLNIVTKLLVVAFSAIVFGSSLVMMERQIATWQLSPGMRIPMLYPYAAITITFGVIALAQAASVALMIRDLAAGGGKAVEGGGA